MIEIKIPSPGESINEVELAKWLFNDGEFVEKDQEIAEIESDKATLPLIAEDSGKLTILVKEGETVSIGTIACTIDTFAKEDVKSYQKKKEKHEKEIISSSTSKKIEKSEIKITPVAQKLMDKNNISVDDVISGIKRITKKEVETVIHKMSSNQKNNKSLNSREETRVKLSSLRKKLSDRLVAVKNETAMLTTFNEVDMSNIISIRKKYQQKFIDKHGVKLGLMSFFTKAASIALQHFPNVNSMIDGDELVSYHYSDIGIAVKTDKGLMVPVLRNTEVMSLVDIEKQTIDLAEKARKFRLSIEEMKGGTFTITNGGVFGSMLSTPILNPPQAGILGMHNIIDRPVAINGKVEIRPIMYLALSYDHRIIDGRDSVSFLYKIKELIESPYKMLLEGGNPEELLLELD